MPLYVLILQINLDPHKPKPPCLSAGNIRSVPAHLELVGVLLIRVIGLIWMDQFMFAGSVLVAKCVREQQMALGCVDRCGRQSIKESTCASAC